MIDLNDMVIFAKVAELQGISPAARALNMPKSKVSRRMAMLEEALGSRLLERSTRSVHVTEAGNLYLKHCRRVADEAKMAEESVHQLSDSPRGFLRISASVTSGQQLLAPYFGEFMRSYPDIEIELDLNNRRVDMIAEGYDLVVRVGLLQDSNLRSKQLGKSNARLYAAPGYLQEHGVPGSVADLVNHRTLVMTDASRAYRWLLENKSGQQDFVQVHPKLSVNDLSTLRRITLDGAGVAFMPDYLARDFVKEGSLTPVLPDWKSPDIPYYVLYPSQLGLAQKARVWIDFFADKLENANSSIS